MVLKAIIETLILNLTGRTYIHMTKASHPTLINEYNANTIATFYIIIKYVLLAASHLAKANSKYIYSVSP